MKRWLKKALLLVCILALLTGCNNSAGNEADTNNNATTEEKTFENATVIELSDNEIKVDGNTISNDTSSAVYAAKDIVFYLEGQDFTYGEGTEADEHSQAEADEHTVIHITQPGSYALSGSLSAGQIAVDLGEDAEEDPNAVVTLILNGVDINCSVAPAVIFYNVYECSSADAEAATKDVDTTAAGANVLIADGTTNNVTGSYVARIYKSVELNEAGTEVVDSKKLHKYDGAFYSKMTMNINGDENGTGTLSILAENEGLDSELHLTINGGKINITSGNDGINTNEDGVSVTTINGGELTIKVNGSTGEGDGIDSNGWLVINGGTVIAEACSTSADAGIDSDMGIHINGGTVIATGNMLDRISESNQNYAVFNFASGQTDGGLFELKNEAGDSILVNGVENGFSYFIYSSPELTSGTYTFWKGNEQLAAIAGEMTGGMPGGGMGMPDGEMPEGLEPPEDMEIPENREFPEDMENRERPEGMPEGMTPPEGNAFEESMENGEHPENMPENGQRPGGGNGGRGPGGFGMLNNADLSTEFIITNGGNYFSNVSIVGTNN